MAAVSTKEVQDPFSACFIHSVWSTIFDTDKNSNVLVSELFCSFLFRVVKMRFVIWISYYATSAVWYYRILTQSIKVQDENIEGFLNSVPSVLSFVARSFRLAAGWKFGNRSCKKKGLNNKKNSRDLENHFCSVQFDTYAMLNPGIIAPLGDWGRVWHFY